MGTTPAPRTKNWKAWQNLMPPGPLRLIVTGDVEIRSSNQTPHLREHAPQGINPKILLLDLTISTSGVGDDKMGWKTVRFEKEIAANQYSEVDVLWEGEMIAHIDVETAT